MQDKKKSENEEFSETEFTNPRIQNFVNLDNGFTNGCSECGLLKNSWEKCFFSCQCVLCHDCLKKTLELKTCCNIHNIQFDPEIIISIFPEHYFISSKKSACELLKKKSKRIFLN